MDADDFNLDKNVSENYLKYREQVLKYTNEDMNLKLDNDQQIYIAVFDIPIKSNIVGFQTQTLALVFGLNTHIYHGSGSIIVGLEEYLEVKKAMQSLLISSHQILNKMKIVSNYEYYNNEFIRAYLKTKKGIYFKELNGNSKEDKFLMMLIGCIMKEIAKTGKMSK